MSNPRSLQRHVSILLVLSTKSFCQQALSLLKSSKYNEGGKKKGIFASCTETHQKIPATCPEIQTQEQPGGKSRDYTWVGTAAGTFLFDPAQQTELLVPKSCRFCTSAALCFFPGSPISFPQISFLDLTVFQHISKILPHCKPPAGQDQADNKSQRYLDHCNI